MAVQTATLVNWQFGLALRLLQDDGLPYATLRRSLASLAADWDAQTFAFLWNDDGDEAIGAGDSVGSEPSPTAWKRAAVLASNLRASSTPQTSPDGELAGAPLRIDGRISGALVSARYGRPYAALDLIALAEAAEMIGVGFSAALQRARAAQAQEAQRQIEHDLTAMTFHDLRTPLQNVQASLTALARLNERSENNPKTTELISAGKSAVRQMGSMIQSLLEFERLEAGAMRLQMEPLAIDQVVEDALTHTAPQAAAARQRVVAEFPPQLPPVQADRLLVSRVLTNLLENAVKHTPPGGLIRVTAVADANWLRVTVSDNGPGVPRHLRQAVFDKYFRVREHAGREGLGLGLAFCRMAIEAHGGQIWVDGDYGARFHFTLPLAER